MKKYTAHIAVLLANLFFGFNFSAVKIILKNPAMNAYGLSAVRILGTVIILALIYLPSKNQWQKIEKKDWLRFGFCALNGIALNQLLFIKGLSLTYPVHAALLMLATPILITIVAGFVLREKINVIKVLGLLLGILGSLILILSATGVTDSLASNPQLGDVLILVNAALYTFYFIMVKPLTEKYNLLTVMLVLFALGLLFIAPLTYTDFEKIEWTQLSNTDLWLLAGLIICGTLLSYVFTAYGISVLGASVSGAYIYAQPIFSAVFAAIFLHERITLPQVVSCLLIFVGVYISNRATFSAKNLAT